MPVELGLTPDNRWDIDVAALVEAAGSAGFEALGLLGSRADESAALAYRSRGLRCHELMALLVTEEPDATTSAAESLAAAAATMGAPWVNTVFRAPATGETARVIERCAAIFAEAGSGMAVEFSPLGPVTSIRAGLEVVEIAGAGRAGLMIDTWHFSFGESTWDDLAEVPLERIAYIQFDDALAPESDRMMRETLHRRAMPGDGILELDRFSSTLLGRGWEGVVSVEVLSSELRALPVDEFARRAYETTARFWL